MLLNLRSRRDVVLPVLAALALLEPTAAEVQVPFTARLSGSSEFTFLSATEVLEDYSGRGQATHLGRLTAELRHIIDLTTTEVLDGTLTLTAANGDIVAGSYSGRGEPLASGLIRFEGTFTIESGTGRFSDVTGEGEMLGLIDPAHFPESSAADLTLDGTISSIGNGRR